MSSEPPPAISPARRRVHAVGVGAQVLGAAGVALGFLGFAVGGLRSASSFGREGNPVTWWAVAVIGTVLLAVGRGLRRLGARGLAGSGLVLDPDRAAEDLEPWARTGGRLVDEALHEVRFEGREQPEVRVRCRSCRALNDEDARYCDQCGAEL